MTSALDIPKCRIFNSDHVLLPDISYQSFTVPGDEEALAALKKVPGATPVLIYLQKHFTEELIFAENNEQMIRVGTRSYSSLHALVARCAEILSCPVPEVYVSSNPVMGAYTTGHRRTSIVLDSGLVQALTADELSFVIGHELGHIKCGHGIYRQLGNLLLQYWDAAATQIPIPGIGLFRIPLILAYWEWYRRAELTCDRAGLLCLQFEQPALSALAKLAGKIAGFEEELDIDSVIAQASAHQEVGKLVRIISIINNAQNTHPFVPLRLKNLRTFAASDLYENILRGKYKRDALGLHEGGLRVHCDCGAEVNIKLSFCPKCGKAVDALSNSVQADISCKGCGNILPPEVKYCSRCGAKQEIAAATKPSSAFDRLKPGFLKRN